MKYTVKQYSEALLGAWKDAPTTRKHSLERFIMLLEKNKDSRKLPLILQQVERDLLKKNDLVKVEIESPNGVSEELKAEIEKMLGKKMMLTERKNKDLLAGITLLVNDSIFIDASARTRLDSAFQKN